MIKAFFVLIYINEFSTTTALVSFTIKPRAVDLGESQVYQELLCFSTTRRHEWSLATTEVHPNVPF